jgi:hypothetical protein
MKVKRPPDPALNRMREAQIKSECRRGFAIIDAGSGETLSVRRVLEDVVPAFERLRQQGKTRLLGLTSIGDTTLLHPVVDACAFDSAQVVYNMLNPSAATELPPNYPAQDYGRLFDHTTAAGVGVVGIRVLAGGALSGSTDRHPIASPPPEPIGSAMSCDADVARACRLLPLVKEGLAASLTEPHAVCDLAFGDGDHLGRHGNAAGTRRAGPGGHERPVLGSLPSCRPT